MTRNRTLRSKGDSMEFGEYIAIAKEGQKLMITVSLNMHKGTSLVRLALK
jgi:hypothetical protein